MDPDLITKTITNLGGYGALCAVLWAVAKRFMDETVAQMTARIDALEKGHEACDEDRRRITSEFITALREIKIQVK